MRDSDKQYIYHVHRTAESVGSQIVDDIEYQTTKFGPQRLTGLGWITVLVEEFGETAQAYMKRDLKQAQAEARQTIACLSRFITELEREEQGLHEEEADRYTIPV